MKYNFIVTLHLLISGCAFGQVDLSVNALSPVYNHYGAIAETSLSFLGPGRGLEAGFYYNIDKYEISDVTYESSGLEIPLLLKAYITISDNKIIMNRNENFYLAVIARYTSSQFDYLDSYNVNHSRIGIGPYAGYKFVRPSGFIFEIGIGIDRMVSNQYRIEEASFNPPDWPKKKIAVLGKFALGFRIGHSKKDSNKLE